MGDRYDVAARLADGQPALERIQAYVQACQVLGYQQPDLTAHSAQVGDWYATEAGLDLRVLDGDATELRVALTAIEEALWVQRTQVTELAAAWRGSGAESAARFLQRHSDAAEEVAARVRAAAQQCATLRDDLWQAVDGKVASTVAIDERHAADRPAWLAAARATPGSKDAERIVHEQVIPFVDNSIRNDWLAAVSAANASVAASYDSAIHALASTREVRFEIPSELGPRWQPAAEERAIAAVTPAMPLVAGPLPTMPAAAHVPRTEPDEAPATDHAGDVAPLDEPIGLSSGAGGLGGLGGMGGVFGSIVDSIGSLLGSVVGGLGGGSGMENVGVEDNPVDVDDLKEPLADGPHEPSVVDQPAVVDDDVVPATPVAENPPATGESVMHPVTQPVAQPVDPPAAQAAPTQGVATPCEIAEDQLPQVGR